MFRLFFRKSTRIVHLSHIFLSKNKTNFLPPHSAYNSIDGGLTFGSLDFI